MESTNKIQSIFLFVSGSYFYHRIWWPFVGKRIMEVIEANTSWGQVFAEFSME